MSPPQVRRRPRGVASTGGRGKKPTKARDSSTTWTRLDEVTLPIVRAAVLRLIRAERAIDGPYDSRASARLDKAIVRLEELAEA